MAGPGTIVDPTPAGARRRPARRVREIPLEERPRERLAARGIAGLTNPELIALVWGSGARGLGAVDLAEEALARHDGLAGLARASELELVDLPGVGAAKAAQLAAAFELGRRLLADWPAGRWTVRAPRDVADRLLPAMGHLEREELRVVLLNAKNAVLKVVTVYQGNVSASAGPGRGAVPGRGAGQRRGRRSSSTTTRPATRRRRRTTCTSPPRPSPPAASSTSSCSTTS